MALCLVLLILSVQLTPVLMLKLPVALELT